MILVKTFYAYNDLRNFSYLILDKNTGNSWVIDPYESRPIIDYIKKNDLVLKGILNTHQHYDHIRGNSLLIETFKAPVKKLRNSETVELGDGHQIETLDTPGHTPDHQVYFWKNNGQELALFSGDTLFNSGVGNCHSGDVNQLYDTTEKLLTHSPEMLLYPGHDYIRKNLEFALSLEPSNQHIQERLREIKEQKTEELSPLKLKDELLLNPFLRLDSEEIKENVVHKQDVNRKELFIKLRKLRDNL